MLRSAVAASLLLLAVCPASFAQPNSPPVSQGLAQSAAAFLANDDIDQARRTYGQLLEQARFDRDQDEERAAEFGLGRVALAAHDPAAAIRYFEHSVTKETHEWLVTALMMESRSPSDSY